MKKRIVASVAFLLIGLLAVLAPAAFAQGPSPQSSPTELPQLIVEFAATSSEGITAEQAIEIFQGGPEVHDLRGRAGNPQRVRYLLADRLTAAIRSTLRPDDPVEDLHHWLIFEYPTLQASKAALARIVGDRQAFKHAHQADSVDHLSVDPANPLYDYTGGVGGVRTSTPAVPGTSPMAAYEALNIPKAWSQVLGFAQVGAIDNGLELDVNGIGVHPDLKANFRQHFSRNFSGSDDVNEPQSIVQGYGDLRGHGTHVSGLIAAEANNSAGSRGVCGQCSLSMLRRGVNELSTVSTDQLASGISVAMQQGVQVYNWSGGIPYNLQPSCGFSPQPPSCTMLAVAAQKDVFFVASAGNTDSVVQGHSQWPANQAIVVSSGASAYGAPLAVATFSPGDKVDYLTPGERILSTFYYQPGTAFSWNPDNAYGNGTSCLGQSESSDVIGYGYCSGTSMSSPILAGSAALVRSANPLLTVADTKAALSRHAQSTVSGIPVPNVGLSVYSSMWGYYGMSGFPVNGGVTPLFSLYHPGASGRHFYTTIPQVGAAASCGMMRIGLHGWFSDATPSGAFSGMHYIPTNQNPAQPNEGSAVNGYSQHPGACVGYAPVASVKLFTTVSRFGISLIPLYRMSQNGMQGAQPSDSANRTLLVGHAYLSNAAEIPYFQTMGYLIDGIEGYVYPPSLPQPSGTVALYRRYKSSIYDYGLFTDSQLTTAGSGYAPLGYRPDGQLYDDIIGYACPNTASPAGVCASTPQAPGLFTPLGGTLSTTPLFAWIAAQGATAYRFVLQGAGGATLIDSTYSNAQAQCEMSWQSCLIQPNYTISSGVTYNWYVVPLNAFGNGGPSTTGSFVLGQKAVITAPPPGSTLTSSSVTFSFTSGVGASSLYMMVGTTPGGNNLFDSFVSGTSQAVSGLPTNGVTIYVRLQSYIGGWQSNDYTYTASSVPPPTPITISPNGTIDTRTPPYVWNASAGAATYRLLVQNGNGVIVDQSYSAAQAGCASGGTCTVTPSAPVNASQQYTMQVSATNGGGTSALSSPRTFTAGAPAIPVAIAPSGTITTVSPTYSWNAVPTTTTYTLYVVASGTTIATISQNYTPAQVGCANNTGVCQIMHPTSLSHGTTYVWSIAATNGVGSQWNNGTSITTPAGPPTNWALSSNGGIASASSTYGTGFNPNAANDGVRASGAWGNGAAWNDATAGVWGDWLVIDFPAARTIRQVVVYTLQDDVYNPNPDPGDSATFTSYGITDFNIEYWNGGAWVQIGSVANNNHVKTTFNFTAVTTTRIRVNILNGHTYSVITEVEAYDVAPVPLTNWALSANGGTASASSSYGSGFFPNAANDGVRASGNWGAGAAWNDGTAGAWGDWLQIDFSAVHSISQIIVYTLQDNVSNPSEPTDTMTFTQYGITDFQVEYWNGSAWVVLGSVTGNSNVKRTFNFSPVTTSSVRVVISGGHTYSVITEVEAFGT